MIVRRLLVVLALGAVAVAQPAPEIDPTQPATPPELAPSVLRALEAPYLSEEEGRDLRVFHGVWREGDLDTPARRAEAALMRGAYDSPALLGEDAPVEDRAEALIVLGRTDEALDRLDGLATARSVRLTAQAYETAGDFERAATALEPLLGAMSTTRVESAPALVEGVRGVLIRTRVAGQSLGAGEDFRATMALLGRARDELDRTYWPARLVEAELLHQKDNRAEAVDAAMETLAQNPKAARAWLLLGTMAAEGFDFARAEQVANRLDAMAPDAPDLSGASILGDLLRARIRLRQRDADDAMRMVERVLARAPGMPEALELQAAAAAGQFDFDRVEALVAEADARAPDSHRTLLEVGRVLSDTRQYPEAIEYLRRAAERAPHRAEPWVELGLVALQAGDDGIALDALTRANELEPFNIRAANSLTLIETLLEYARLDSDHFIIRYQPGVDEVLARDMLVVLERIHDRVTGRENDGIDFEPSIRTQIELMPDHRWFAVRIAGMPAIHTMAAATGPVLALEAPRVGKGHTVGHYDWPRVVQHEYTHTVTLARTNNRIPHWMTEAAAVHMEDAPRDYGRCRLLAGVVENGELFDLEAVSIAFIRPRKQTDRAQAYAQSHWMYEFIIDRWGNDANLELMDAYARGDTQDEAFLSVLGVTPEQFMEMFEPWATGQIVGWGLLPAAGEPTLEQIRLADAMEDEARRAGLAAWLARAARAASWTAAGSRSTMPRAPALPEPTDESIGRWLAAYPAHPDVLEAAIASRLRATDGALDDGLVDLLERYAEARPVDPLPHRLLADYYLDGEDPSLAIEHLEWLDAREQHSVAYAAELARRYAAIGDWDRAHAAAERVTQMAPYRADHRELAASVAIKAGAMDDARRHLEALVILEPDREIHARRLEALDKLMRREGNPPSGTR